MAVATAAPAIFDLPIEAITLDPRLQPRERMDEGVIGEYGGALEEGDIFPPVVVFEDSDGGYWLADGFHRVAAHRASGRERVRAEVRLGDWHDALLYSVRANDTHGIRRTNADKRRAVGRLLEQPRWKEASSRWIAEQCGVDDHMVARVRDEFEAERAALLPATGSTAAFPQLGEPSATRIGKDNKRRPAKQAKRQTHPTPAPARELPEPAAAEDDPLEQSDETLALTGLLGMVPVTRYTPEEVAACIDPSYAPVAARELATLGRWIVRVSDALRRIG